MQLGIKQPTNNSNNAGLLVPSQDLLIFTIRAENLYFWDGLYPSSLQTLRFAESTSGFTRTLIFSDQSTIWVSLVLGLLGFFPSSSSSFLSPVQLVILLSVKMTLHKRTSKINSGWLPLLNKSVISLIGNGFLCHAFSPVLQGGLPKSAGLSGNLSK